MNEYSPVDAANSHWRRRTRPPASRLAPTTRVSPLLHSFFLPSSYHLRRLYQLRSSILLARIPLSLSLSLLLSLHPSSILSSSSTALPYLVYTSVFFYPPLLLSRSPFSLFLRRARTAAYARLIVAPTLEDDDRRECTRGLSRTNTRAEARPFLHSVGSFIHASATRFNSVVCPAQTAPSPAVQLPPPIFLLPLAAADVATKAKKKEKGTDV